MNMQDPFSTAYDPRIGVQGGTSPAQSLPSSGMAQQGGGGDNPLDTLIQQLISGGGQKPGLAQRFGPLPVPFEPLNANPNPLQYLLRGAVSGYNARANSGLNGRDAAKLDALLRLRETQRYHDAQIGNMSHDNTSSDAYHEWLQTHGDATLGDKVRHEGVTEGQGDRHLDQGDRRLDITIRGQDLNHGDRQEGLGLSRERLALSQQREARQARVASAMMKWPEYMKNDYITQRQEAFKKYGADKDLLEAELDRVAADFEQRDKGLASTNPFDNRDQYGKPKNDVVKGGSTTAAPKAAPKKKGWLDGILGGGQQAASPAPATNSGKPSDNPNLTPEQRAFYKKQGM